MKYIGGYSILDLTDANVSAQANVCYNQDKPVLVYGANGERYFADTITKSGTNIIITKGGKTITIANDNTITSEGIIENPTLENIVDLNGNKRFVEGDVTANDIEGVTYTFKKWSLSGSHLMIVIAGTVANTTVLSYGTNSLIKCGVDFPQWIKDKINPMISNKVDIKTFNLLENGTTTQSFAFTLYKESNHILINQTTDLTLDKDRGFRIQFDLLIDQE